MPTWGSTSTWGTYPWGGSTQWDAADDMTQILYNEGAQTIRHIPIDRHGRVTRVSTASYSIVDLRRGEDDPDRVIQASTAATVDNTSTTLTAAAGPATSNPRLLQVASASSFTEGHTYVLQEDGQREAFVVHRKDTTNSNIYTQTDLRHAYTIGAQVLGVEMSGTFPAAEANDEDEVEAGAGPYLAIWDYQINGAGYLVSETIWLTRYAMPPFVDEAYVLEAFPALARSLRGDGPSLTMAIKAAHDDFMAELEAAGIDPTYFKVGNYGRNLVRTKAIEYMHRWKQTDQDSAEADRWEERYMRLLGNLTTGKPPQKTVRIAPVTDTAPAGSSQLHGHAYITRS